jgi:hypothetical protein
MQFVKFSTFCDFKTIGWSYSPAGSTFFAHSAESKTNLLVKNRKIARRDLRIIIPNELLALDNLGQKAAL